MDVLIKHQILQRQQILFHNRKNRESLNITITNSFVVALQIIFAKFYDADHVTFLPKHKVLF